MRYPYHHVACNFPGLGPVENCRQCKDFELRDHAWYRRCEMVRTGQYTHEIMTKAEEIFWADPVVYSEYDVFRSLHQPGPASKTRFESWLETPSAPTQSYFAKLARIALGK